MKTPSHTRNVAYSNAKEFKAIQEANAIAQDKQDKGRYLGRNTPERSKHDDRFTKRGGVFNGLRPGRKQFNKSIGFIVQ